MAINEPNQPRVPSTNRPANNSAATIYPARSSAPSNNPGNSNVATTYPPRSSAPPNTSTSKRRKGSITNDTLNASRYKEVLRANESQASVHGSRGSTSEI